MAEAPLVDTLDGLQQSYDETPYHDQRYPLFTLDRLLGHAQLFGLCEPGRTSEGARVLDLGCASGQHLRHEAALHPHTSFTGIDFSSEEIELGRKAVCEEGLVNVELVQADLRGLEVEPGAFDVVVCHGVFSWVPDDVKERILLLCRQALAPGGVGAIAYLTYPGWKQREAIRELLTMRDRSDRPARERIEESARLLRVLQASYASREDDPHAAGLLAVVESMQQSSSNAFVHDELGSVHDPCYFLQFVEWAGECGLQYLAEADLGSMSTEALAPADARILDTLAPNALETQQLVDFVVNRSGRASLLTRDDAAPARQIGRETLTALHYATRWWDVTPLNARDDEGALFESPAGRRMETTSPDVRALLSALTEGRDRTWSWPALRARIGLSDDELLELIPALLAKGVLEPRAPSV